jgi:hypothetical protein
MFNDSEIYLEDFEVFLFVSPEERCLYGLRRLPQIGNLKRVWLAEFIDYDIRQPSDLSANDKRTIKRYHKNLATLKDWASLHTFDIKSNKYRLNLLEPFDDSLGSPSPFNSPILVDISCAPRGHLLSLLNYLARCQIVNYQKVVLMYSLVQQQSKSEDDYSYGMEDIAVVPGFNGQIRLKHDLLIVVLGFEGNRAFSLYRRLAPSKTFAILGDTYDSEDRNFYLKQAKENNHSILSLPSVEIRTMASRDPDAFLQEFNNFLNIEINPNKDKYNIYFSCLGTKLQTVGAFLALQTQSHIQVVDALPSRRRIASEGKRETVFEDFGNNNLVDPSVYE